MLHIVNVRKNKETYVSLLRLKGFDASILMDTLIAKDDERKLTQQKADDLLARGNQLAKKIGELYKTGNVKDADTLKKESVIIKEDTKLLQTQQYNLENEIQDILIQIPNVPHHSVPSGGTDKDNIVIKESGFIPDLIEEAKPHWELLDEYKLVDFDLGTKITGSGFPVYFGQGAKLQRALINYFIDKNLEAGYIEYLPPHVVNKESGFGTGQLPKFEDELYKIPGDSDLYLIPTAEVPVTNFFRNMIVKELPIKCTAYTPCFRREAGSYGKEVRGLNRLHQFDKVEIVQIVDPEESYQILDNMVEHVSTLLDELELPYKIVQLCGGDLSESSALTFDFEVYSAAQKRWLEVSSVSNFESYQANRLKLRYKDTNGNINLCHTLNGSALALPRIFAAIIENNQILGGINIPKVLHSYTGFDIIK